MTKMEGVARRSRHGKRIILAKAMGFVDYTRRLTIVQSAKATVHADGRSRMLVTIAEGVARRRRHGETIILVREMGSAYSTRRPTIV